MKKILILSFIILSLFLVACTQQATDEEINAALDELSAEEQAQVFEYEESAALAGEASKIPASKNVIDLKAQLKGSKLALVCEDDGESIRFTRGDWEGRPLAKYFCLGDNSRERVCNDPDRDGYTSELVRCEHGCDAETGRCVVVDEISELACGDIYSVGEGFLIDGTRFTYTEGEAFAFASVFNWDTEGDGDADGQRFRVDESRDDERSYFILNHSERDYLFRSASDPSVDDWDIEYVCDLSCSEVIEDEDYFVLDEDVFEYKGSDDVGETNAGARVKEIATGETFDRAIEFSGSEVEFSFAHRGISYYFANASNAHLEDWAIERTACEE